MRPLLILLLALLLAGAYLYRDQLPDLLGAPTSAPPATREAPRPEPITEALFRSDPMSIAAMRARQYPGSALTVKRDLPRGVNYTRQVVSYESDGLTIYALLTVPDGTPPQGGWPAIVFNHGYIPPDEYQTTERYVAYQDAFARAGFITLKSDYRGHGASEGEARGGYNDPGYTTDVLNAAASLRRDARVNDDRLGMWGHSMGGQLTLRAMVVDPGIKAGVIWAGVVAPYEILRTTWGRDATDEVPPIDPFNRAYLRAISPNTYLRDLRGPLQLHHGTADEDVPYRYQVDLARGLRAANVGYEAFRYEGDDHNLSRNLGLALRRSVAFFKEHL